jgi:methylglutaconyl-CoA hydratase
MEKPYVKTSKTGGIGIIEFFHPHHNALPSALLQLLVEALNAMDLDASVSLILLQSGGNRSFCAGANFDELMAIEDMEEGLSFFKGFGNVINAIRTNRKIVVGRIQGKAVGGGVGIAAAADISFATKFASVRLSEISIGIGPFVIAPAVERKIGTAAFADMALRPEKWVTAEKACVLGLFSEVFEDMEAMDEFLKTYLEKMSNYNPDALKALKKIFWQGTENWSDLLDQRAELSGKLVLSDFTRQALEKFKK